MNSLLASLLSGISLETIGLAAVLVTGAGVWLQWQRQEHVADIEEALKDGRLLPQEAERRMRWVTRRATGAVVAGVGLLIAVAYAWVRSH